jgi:hypothetical protein
MKNPVYNIIGIVFIILFISGIGDIFSIIFSEDSTEDNVRGAAIALFSALALVGMTAARPNKDDD